MLKSMQCNDTVVEFSFGRNKKNVTFGQTVKFFQLLGILIVLSKNASPD